MTIDNVPYTSYEQKITAEFITGGAPDVFWVNTPLLGTFIKDGMLTNIAPLIKANHIDMAQYYPQLVALHSRGSAIYGLPKDWDTIALYYNKAYFAKLHLTVPANLSWNTNGTGSFVTFLKEATTDTSGHNALSPQFNPSKVATYGHRRQQRPAERLGQLRRRGRRQRDPASLRHHGQPDHPQVNVGMTFLTKDLAE